MLSPSPYVDVNPADAGLFQRCRKALGMTVSQLQDALSIADERTIRRWEQGVRIVTGPTWVALCYMLRDHGREDLVLEISKEWHKEHWQ